MLKYIVGKGIDLKFWFYAFSKDPKAAIIVVSFVLNWYFIRENRILNDNMFKYKEACAAEIKQMNDTQSREIKQMNDSHIQEQKDMITELKATKKEFETIKKIKK